MDSTMKDSGINWIGDIPVEWSINKIKYLATEENTVFIDGDWIESDVICDEGIRYLTTGNVGTGFFKNQGDSYISEITFKNLHCLSVYPGDLMISRLNEPIGRACIVPQGEEKYVVSVDNVILRPNHNVDRRFLMYVMNSDGYSSLANITARGSTMSRISRTQLGQFFIPVPTNSEQLAIANYLDKKCSEIDGIINKIEKQIEKLNDYKKSLIQECVTKGLDKTVKLKKSGVNWIGDIPVEWSVNKIKYLATEENTVFIDGDWIESDVICDEGIRYFTTGNVGPGYFKDQGDSYISDKTFNDLHCLSVYPGDLMISRLNEPIGRACIVPQGEEKYVVAVDNVILRPNHNIDRRFLMYVMNSDGYSSLANITARGSTMSRISRTQLGQFFIPVPTYNEQKCIADYLDNQCCKTNEIILKKQKQLLDMKQYKSSLIYEYVTGKKRVKVGE